MNIAIYVINLDRSPERLAKISGRLVSLGQSFFRVPGVNGIGLSSDEISRVRATSTKWTPLNAGEVGCFLSHRKCWEIIAKGTGQFGCVLEDDVVLSDSFSEAIQVASHLPPNLDILKLDTTFKRMWVDRKPITIGTLKTVRLRSGHYGAGAYILSKRAAQKILDQSATFALGVDVFLFDPLIGAARDLRIYQCAPAVCGHDYFIYPDRDTETTIGQGRHCAIETRLSRRGRRLSEETRKVFHWLLGRRRISVPLV